MVKISSILCETYRIVMPPVLQPADEREQALDLVTRERGGGLVHDEDLRVEHQGLADLDDLLVGHGEGTHGGTRVDRRVEERQDLRTPPAHGPRVRDPPRADRLAAEKNVFSHREVADHGELLEDGRHAVALGIVHGAEPGGTPSKATVPV